MDIFSIAAGAAGVGVVYFLYLAATKGLPAAYAWAKARWNAGTSELASLEADLAGASAKVTALEQGAVAELKAGLAAVQADVAALKAKAGLTAVPTFINLTTPVTPPAT